MDNVTPSQRSYTMSRIKQRDTKMEQDFRRALWRCGIRYRKNVRVLGTPDLMMSRHKVVVFLDSCFWHGCRYHCRRPKSNISFWQAKIERNRQRDRKVTSFYRRQGWHVLRFWEHRLASDLAGCVSEVRRAVAEASHCSQRR
jgi:DNA mismatch endonuclease (patch repair protein)